MLQIEPSEILPITRQLEDTSDSTTRYVQAKIYKPANSATAIDTVNLTDNGGQFFSGNYTVPHDARGDKGYFLLVVIKVYDDAAYTIESNRYERSHITYLVQTRWKFAFGAGSGVDISYKKISEIIREEIKKIPKTEIPIPKEVDFQPLLDAISDAKNKIKDIKFPEQEKINLLPVLERLDNLKKIVGGIEIPQPEKPKEVNLEPVLSAIKSLGGEIRNVIDSLKQASDKMQEQTLLVEKHIGSILEVFSKGLPLKMSLSDLISKPNEEPQPKRKSVKDYFKDKL